MADQFLVLVLTTMLDAGIHAVFYGLMIVLAAAVIARME